MTALVVVRPTDAEVRERHAELAAFERAFTYPLGADRFRIDHGADYLAFFRGLGEPSLSIAETDGRIAGVLVAVRRRLPEPCWYLCDLKVAPGATGAGRRLLAAFDRELRGTRPAYGISMDPARGPNRVVRAALRCPGVDVRAGPRLSIYSLDLATWRRVERDFAAALGAVGFRDPRGEKDIVLESTGAPMPLVHVQHGPLARPNVDGPRGGHIHMACLPSAHPLVGRLQERSIAPDATASVLHHAMDSYDWSSVLTSDI